MGKKEAAFSLGPSQNPTSGSPATIKKKIKKKSSEKGDSPSFGVPFYIKILGLAILIPMVFSVPFLLKFISSHLYERQDYFYAIWSLYAGLLAFFYFYYRKETITLNSFITQNLSWGIFAMGSYMLLDIQKLLDPHLRQTALWTWLTFTMIFNFVFFLFDSTNYKVQEEKQAEEDKKEEEKRKRWDEEYNRDFLKDVPPTVRQILNICVYIVILLICYSLFNFYNSVKIRMNERNGVLIEEPEFQPSYD